MAVEAKDCLISRSAIRCKYDALDVSILVEDALSQEVSIEVALASKLRGLEDPFVLLGEGEHP